ncbi:lipid phosphate phosphatase epsilon 2, chloroplastic-like isoform X2 [Carex rostrata]
MQLSLAFPSILNSSPYKLFSPISFLHSCTSKKRDLKPMLFHKPLCQANLQGFGGKKMAKLNQVNATEDRDDVLRDESLDSSSGSSFRSFESAINKSSKWIVGGLLGLTILWKHDAEVQWAATGSIFNSFIAVTLKRILNHERPSGLRSDPGMPSSHAQSIFYVSIFAVHCLMQWLGVNIWTVSLGAAILALGSYFSWLRVCEQLHTTNQVVVGALFGTIISIAWLWLWHAFVYDAFVSFIWVRIILFIFSISLFAAFVIYVIQNWLNDQHV